MAISCLPEEAATFSRFYLKWLHESVDTILNGNLVLPVYCFAGFYSVLGAELSRTITLVLVVYLMGLGNLN